MVSTCGGCDFRYCTHDCNGQLLPLSAGSQTDTAGPNSRGLANSFHLSKYSPREGFGPRELEAGSGRVRRPSPGHECADVADSCLRDVELHEKPDEISHNKEEGGIFL